MFKRITPYLAKCPELVFVLFAMIAAFTTYTSMYAFRKAFTIAKFAGMEFLHVDYKIWLILAQVIGYMLSKLIGIKIVSEMSDAKRGVSILVLIGISGLALLGFALVPAPWGIAFLFLNGLPIGMIFGIVFRFLEGRKSTDLLIIGLMLTFIFSSGLIKSIGSYVMSQWHVSETWMPFVTGMLFVPVLFVSVGMLCALPPPNPQDVAAKTQRKPMDKQARRAFLSTFAFGLVAFVGAYLALMILRDFRDNFTREIWSDLGVDGNHEIYTQTEIPIALMAITLVASFRWIKSSLTAFIAVHFAIIGGALLIALSTWLFAHGHLSAFWWFSLVGMGLYLGFVTCNSLFFEHLISLFKYSSTAAFMITTSDFYGYFGSLGMTLYKNFGSRQVSYLSYFMQASCIIAAIIIVLMSCSLIYFLKKYRSSQPPKL
jgi:hypothetical protein